MTSWIKYKKKVIDAILFRPLIENKLYAFAGLGLSVFVTLYLPEYHTFSSFILYTLYNFIQGYYISMFAIGFGYASYYAFRLDKLYLILQSPLTNLTVRKWITALSNVTTVVFIVITLFLRPEPYVIDGLIDLFIPFVMFLFIWGLFFGFFYIIYLMYYLLFMHKKHNTYSKK